MSVCGVLPILNYKMLKGRSQSTDITPLVNSAVEKLQELGIAYKMAVIFRSRSLTGNISFVLLLSVSLSAKLCCF